MNRTIENSKKNQLKTNKFHLSNLMVPKINGNRDRSRNGEIETSARKRDGKSGKVEDCCGGTCFKIQDRAIECLKIQHSDANYGKAKVSNMGSAATTGIIKLVPVEEECVAVKEVRKKLVRINFGAGKTVNRSFKFDIPTGFAELITTMKGCVCRYIRRKSKVSKIRVYFSFGKSNKWKVVINGTNDQTQHALRLLDRLHSVKW